MRREPVTARRQPSNRWPIRRCADPPLTPVSLHWEQTTVDARDREVDRLVALGASRVDVGQAEQPWVVLADPEGNEFCVLGSRRSP